VHCIVSTEKTLIGLPLKAIPKIKCDFKYSKQNFPTVATATTNRKR